jgi:predicted transcriptional regulator
MGKLMTEKQRALEAVEGLPDDATVEDAIERLCFIAKVKKGINELDTGQGVPHEEVKRRVLGG